MPGIRPPRDLRPQRRDVDHDLAVEDRVGVARQRRASARAPLPVAPSARPAALEIRERRLVGRDHPRARARLDRHVADRQPALHREPLDRRAGVLDHVADAAVDAEPADRGEHEVLRGHAGGQLAVEADRAASAACRCWQRLRREHVLDLGRADAERERAERAVRRGVRVAAHDRHAGLRQPELRADHVHDALAAAAGRVERDAELRAVPRERLELLLRERVDRRVVAGGDVVVHRRERQVGPAHAAAGEPQALERLRRGDLVHEVEVDVEQVGAALARARRRGSPRPSRTASGP